jgi:hypothetical protein
MKRHRNKVPAVSLLLALGLATTLLGSTAHAAGTAKPMPKIAGQHFALMTGFNGETPSTALYHLTIKKSNGNAFIGTQRFRDCTDLIEKCKSEGEAGTGWTEPEAVFLVRTSSKTYVLRSRNSQGQISLGKNGLTKAYVIGSGKVNVSRSNSEFDPYTFSYTVPSSYSLAGGEIWFVDDDSVSNQPNNLVSFNQTQMAQTLLNP